MPRHPNRGFVKALFGISKVTWIAAAMLVPLAGFPVTPATGQSDGIIVYFDPDANHQSISQISRSFSRYLDDAGISLTLQPVQSRQRFEGLLADSRTRYALVASAYLDNSRNNSLRPLLIPTAGNTQYYRKVLVDTGEGSAGNLRGAAIAATVSGQNPSTGASAVLSVLQTGGVDVAGATVIPVSKDIDALLALSFGQVRAALVTRGSIAVMRRINPESASTYRTVYTTNPILRPPLCAVGRRTSQAENRALINALEGMAQDPAGRRVLLRMGFDGWTDPRSNSGGKP